MPRKTSKKTLRRKNKPSKNMLQPDSWQMGGTATYDSDSLAAKYASCSSADRHNLQTGEANLELINGAGVIPAGQTGGATNGTCPGNGALLSFKDYANNIAARLGVNAAYPSAAPQTGGGYAIDPSAEQIGGQPARIGYSDCCPPVSLEGRLMMGANSGAVCGQQAGGAGSGAVCGQQAGGAGSGAVCGQQAGGAGSCGGNTLKAQKGGKKRRHTKGKKTQKKHKTQNPSKMGWLRQQAFYAKQRGGDSVPAAFPAESHSGVDGDFSDHGAQLHYDGRQPFWDATSR
jgi:hypothetical protein